MVKSKKKTVSCFNTSAFSEKHKNLLGYIPWATDQSPLVHSFLSVLHTKGKPATLSPIDQDLSPATCLVSEHQLVVDYSEIPDEFVEHQDTEALQCCVVEPLRGAGVSSTAFLNSGLPIWCLDFSGVMDSHPLPHEMFTVLAVTGSTVQQPVFPAMPLKPPETTLATPPRCVIEFWKIPVNALHQSTLVLYLILNVLNPGGIGLFLGGHCRCLQWMRLSALPRQSIGLLFVTQGDGLLCCYSIPYEPFRDTGQPRILQSNALWETNLTYFLCVSPCPFFTFVDQDKVNADVALRVASGARDGRVHLWYFYQHSPQDHQDGFQVSCQAELLVCDQIPITSVSWCPSSAIPLLAIGTLTGMIKLWDTRRPLDGGVYQIEGAKRPVYHVCWPQVTRFVLACHTSCCVFDSITGECHQRPTSTDSSLLLRSEKPPWSCASLAHLAMFACDSGQLLIYPVNKLGRHSEASQWVNTWQLQPMDPIPSQQKLCCQTNASLKTMEPLLQSVMSSSLPSGEAVQGINQELLRLFYQEASRIYSTSMLCSGYTHKVKLDFRPGTTKAPHKTQREKPPRDQSGHPPDVLHLQPPRLHAVCTLDSPVSPHHHVSLIAVGGSLGLVYIFNPTTLRSHRLFRFCSGNSLLKLPFGVAAPMSLNPPIGKNKTTNEVFPLPLENECFILSRTGVSLTLQKPATSEKLQDDGSIFLTNIRLVFIRNKDPAACQNFNSIEFPLRLILHRNGSFSTPHLKQPIFGCNRMEGKIRPDLNAKQPLLDIHDWTLYFKKGGCSAFCHALDYAIGQVKFCVENNNVSPFYVSSVDIAAFYDPNDPSRIYLSQPVYDTSSMLPQNSSRTN